MKQKKSVLRLIGILFLAVILFFVNAFFGNPISYLLTKASVSNYIRKNYSQLQLKSDDPFYNFKIGGYSTYVHSNSSIDTHFSVLTDMWGRVKYDNYYQVTEGWNTFIRLDDEYRMLCNEVFADESFTVDHDISFGEIQLTEAGDVPPGIVFGLDMSSLEIDRIYDIRDIAKEYGHLVLYVREDTCSFEKAAEILLDVKEMFDRAGLPFRAIDFVVRPHDKSADNIINVNNFPYDEISADGLSDKIRVAHEELSEWYAIQDAKMKEELEQ